MTKEDVIRMAREAGYPYANPTTQEREILERFAAIVAAAEREACANVCEYMECEMEDQLPDSGQFYSPIECAAAIRARSNQ